MSSDPKYCNLSWFLWNFYGIFETISISLLYSMISRKLIVRDKW